LGFKQGSIILADGITATQNELKRQGNYVLGRLSTQHTAINNIHKIVGYIPEDFRPITLERCGVIGEQIVTVTGASGIERCNLECQINEVGEIKIIPPCYTDAGFSGSINVKYLNVTIYFGYEANPL
jgi:hypothetical protein